MQLQYQIYLYFDGEHYVASAPELDGCRGSGPSYAAALKSCERVMQETAIDSVNRGRQLPAPAKHFVLVPSAKATGTGRGASVLRRLHVTLGNLTYPQMAVRLGVEDVPAMSFAGAVAGLGARRARLAIARALRERPSNLWPGRSAVTQQRDDDGFLLASGSESS